jgi:molybdopterin synthase catalytic subunit
MRSAGAETVHWRGHIVRRIRDRGGTQRVVTAHRLGGLWGGVSLCVAELDASSSVARDGSWRTSGLCTCAVSRGV